MNLITPPGPIIPPDSPATPKNVAEICEALLRVLDAAPVEEKFKLMILSAIVAKRGGVVVRYRPEQMPDPAACNACQAVRWAGLGQRCLSHSG